MQIHVSSIHLPDEQSPTISKTTLQQANEQANSCHQLHGDIFTFSHFFKHAHITSEVQSDFTITPEILEIVTTDKYCPA